MAQEEQQTQKCSNSSSGTAGGGGGGGGSAVRSCKKQKPKKVPQRGLGVAQLERIRIEEQQKRDGTTHTLLPSHSPTNSSSFSLPITSNYHHPPNHSSPSSINPFPPDHNIPSPPNLVMRPSSSSLHNSEIFNSNPTGPLTNPVGWSTLPIHQLQGHASVHKLWNPCYCNLEKVISGLDPGIAFRSNLYNSLPYESIPIWPLPAGLVHRAHQYQQPSSMVNVSSTTLSSSVLNDQMEPPSNQSYCGNYITMWPEDEKMVGMKRAYPFSLDNPPTMSSLHCKFPPTVLALSRSDDSTSCSSGHTLNSEPTYTNFREGSSSKRNIKENGVVKGGFLTLAPPTTSSPNCQSSKLRHPPPLPLSSNNNNSEELISHFDTLSYQGRVEDPMVLFQTGPGGSNHEQPYYSFFPQAMARNSQATSTADNCNGGDQVGYDQSVDLNLKL